MLKRTIATVFVTALLCLVALPVTALAAAPYGQVIYVGNENVTSGGYWTTDSAGNVTQYNEEGKPSNNYIHYNTATNTLTLHNATIKKSVSMDTSTLIAGAAIGVHNQNGAAELTIILEGTNTIAEVGKGIFVLASSTGGATLTITGDGSLDASASQTGIWVQSNNGDAALFIQNAKVEATGTFRGVNVQSHESSTASLTVDGGSLTASGSPGILYDSIGSGTVPSTTALTIRNSAIVDARGGGIGAGLLQDLNKVSPADDSVGIVFDGNQSTVYGDVILQEDLTIGEGESLTLDDGASLNAGGHNVIVDGGTLDDSIKNSLGDSVTYVVSGVSLDQSALTLTEGGTAQLTATVEPIDATNKKVTWSSSAPGVATVDASGNVTAVAEGTATITATTDDGGKTATCTVTVAHAHKPASDWSSDASGHWHACAGCSEKLYIAAHSGKVVGKRDATCTEAGFTGDTVCSICGYVVAKGVATPATGHSYQDGACTVCGAREPAKDGDSIPATGDLAPAACALAGIFGMALVAAGLRSRTPW